MAYISVAEAKAYIGGESGISDDALIKVIIDGAESFIESYTGRDFKADTDATRYFDSNADTVDKLLILDGDLCSITSVVTNADDGSSGTTITSSEYITIPRNRTPYYALKLLTSSSNLWTYTDDPEMGIEITGKWGWSTSPPADIEAAMKDIVKSVYRSRDANADTAILSSGMVITANDIPKITLTTLNGYRRIPV